MMSNDYCWSSLLFPKTLAFICELILQKMLIYSLASPLVPGICILAAAATLIFTAGSVFLFQIDCQQGLP